MKTATQTQVKFLAVVLHGTNEKVLGVYEHLATARRVAKQYAEQHGTATWWVEDEATGETLSGSWFNS